MFSKNLEHVIFVLVLRCSVWNRGDIHLASIGSMFRKTTLPGDVFLEDP